jgi:hypothetical protein
MASVMLCARSCSNVIVVVGNTTVPVSEVEWSMASRK